MRREKTEGCHDLFTFLPRLASGKKSRTGMELTAEFEEKTAAWVPLPKSLYICTSSFISSLSLLRWLFALLLLGQLRSPWLSEGSIWRPVSSLEQWRGRQEPSICWVQGLSSPQQGPGKAITWPLLIDLKMWESAIWQEANKAKKKNKSNDLEPKADISRKQV